MRSSNEGDKKNLSNYMQWVQAWLEHVRNNEGGTIPSQKIYRTVQDTIDPKKELHKVAPKGSLGEFYEDNEKLFRDCYQDAAACLDKYAKVGQLDVAGYGEVVDCFSPYLKHLVDKATMIYKEVMAMDDNTFNQIFKGVNLSKEEVAKEAAQGYVFGAGQRFPTMITDNTSPMHLQLLCRNLQLTLPFALGKFSDQEPNELFKVVSGAKQGNPADYAAIFVQQCVQDQKLNLEGKLKQLSSTLPPTVKVATTKGASAPGTQAETRSATRKISEGLSGIKVDHKSPVVVKKKTPEQYAAETAALQKLKDAQAQLKDAKQGSPAVQRKAQEEAAARKQAELERQRGKHEEKARKDQGMSGEMPRSPRK